MEHLIKVSASDRRLRECDCRRSLPASQAALAGCKIGGGRGLNTEPLFSPAKCRSLHIPANATRKTAGGLSSCHCIWSDKPLWLGMLADVDTTGVFQMAGDVVFQCSTLIAMTLCAGVVLRRLEMLTSSTQPTLAAAFYKSNQSGIRLAGEFP